MFHEQVFGKPPVGLWPSEGSVSDQALEIAAELGFQWFATDEGVLGRTRGVGFWRDASGFPENATELYTPWQLHRNGRALTGFFRDHYLSDLVGFVYSRMGAEAAAEDLHRRIRAIGDRMPPGRTATVNLILDGENAWEYYAENGREFLRRFYMRIEQDPDVQALTMSEAMQAAPAPPRLDGIFPASWINANFDIWIGHAEDVRAWELLREARDVYEHAAIRAQSAHNWDAWWTTRGKRAYEAILAAEGSDWCWWYGPEHASANDAEFDMLYRSHLTEIYNALGEHAPDALAHPIKRAPAVGRREPPEAFLAVKVDGHESSYFEWLGAGFYSASRRSGAMHGRQQVLGELLYGFGTDHFYIRVDPIHDAIADMPDFQLRITLWDSYETRITLRIEGHVLSGCIVERAGLCLLHPEMVVSAAFGKILEVSVARELFDLHGRRELLLSVALWRGGLPVDVLPLEGMVSAALGEENFGWPAR